MGKIFDNINGMIMSAMKEHNQGKANAYKNMKAKMLEFKTAKNAKPLDDSAETTIIKKMVSELLNDADIFKQNGRNDLSEAAYAEADFLKPLLPKEASESDIEAAISDYIKDNGEFDQKSMGKVIGYVKSKFDNADGGLIARLVKSHL